MRITVKTAVKLNTSVIARLEGQARDLALFKTADWVLGEVRASAKVPKDTGELERSGFVKNLADDIAAIVFDTPYARRWYFNSEGVAFRQEYNANAQDHWMDDFVYGDRKQELIDMYGQFYREELGGLLK